MKKHIVLLIASAYMAVGAGFAQKVDTLQVVRDPVYKNVIKYNPTPKILWSSNNWTFSYERILNNKQSFTVGLGYLEFGQLFKDTIANNIRLTNRWKNGINFSFEYRFYMLKRNNRPLPDGLYLAPYFSFYGYKFGNGLDLINTPADDFAKLTGDFYIFNLGGELGYQFVLWKRMTIDLILVGPSFSYYGGKVNVRGDVEWEDINLEIYEELKEKYPMIDDFVIDKTFKKDGILDLTSFGLRYVLQIGFHF